LVANCVQGTDTQCQVCMECEIGFYETSQCTSTADASCTACEVCAKGTYMSEWCKGTTATDCTRCDDAVNCLDCTGPGDACIECDVGSVLSEGKCIAQCPSGMYDAFGECAQCHPYCIECQGPGENECLADPTSALRCPGGEGVLTSDPASGQPFTCKLNTANTACTSTEYIDASDTCQDCHGSCSTTTSNAACFDGTNSSCLECDAGSSLFGRRQCVATCPSGTFDNAGTCEACPATCTSCSDANTCTGCSGTKYLQGGMCYYLTDSVANTTLRSLAFSPQVS
jgi:hypothetical protein